jgi:S-adenosylmethionine:tRNA ribosyltransferase-isomerase
MKTEDFSYSLPPNMIAQTPLEPRDASRLLVLDKKTGNIAHRHFRQIGEFLNQNDLLVINRTRVIPARLFGHKETGGKVEILLIKKLNALTWEALVGGKGLHKGKKIQVNENLHIEIFEEMDGTRRQIRFNEPVELHLEKVGHTPLPPYIHERLTDPERYQTVYSKIPGSAAAPTAGLHFTDPLIEKLKIQGVKFAEVTLHVGLDTFLPVDEENPEEHKIHSEWCEIPACTVEAITSARESGSRIIAVGTTTTRTLETAALGGPNQILSYNGSTNLYILPGFRFNIVDAMITNFHLPKSTLLMMVSAFAGRQLILDTYQEAIRQKYRFYSFGDAMLIL